MAFQTRDCHPEGSSTLSSRPHWSCGASLLVLLLPCGQEMLFFLVILIWCHKCKVTKASSPERRGPELVQSRGNCWGFAFPCGGGFLLCLPLNVIAEQSWNRCAVLRRGILLPSQGASPASTSGGRSAGSPRLLLPRVEQR